MDYFQFTAPLPGAWELWVTAWAFIATIVLLMAIGWGLIKWWEWIREDDDNDD